MNAMTGGRPLAERFLQPVSLRGHEPFAKGAKRHCYVHPTEPALCIKVAARAGDPQCDREQLADLEDYASLKKRGGTVFDRIAAIEGIVDTDLGLGVVCALCRDADGRISSTLADTVRQRGLTPPLVRAIGELKAWLRAHHILTRDTGPSNVAAVRLEDGNWKLVIIEGLSNRKYRLLTRLEPRLTGYLISRQLRKFDRRLSSAIGPDTPPAPGRSGTPPSRLRRD